MVTLPKTTIRTYISGMHSLTLDMYDGTGSDWHFMNYWRGENLNIKLYGDNCKVNTNPIYGYYGVTNKQRLLARIQIFSQDKVYIANHHRAVLDLLFESLTFHNQIGYVKGCVEDYFFKEKDVEELYFYATQMIPYLDEERGELLSEWISREFKSLRGSFKARKL